MNIQTIINKKKHADLTHGMALKVDFSWGIESAKQSYRDINRQEKCHHSDTTEQQAVT